MKVVCNWSMVMVLSMMLALIVFTVDVDAKRGCKSYGHSCYGGVGKRNSDEINEEVLDDVQIDENPEFVLTASNLSPLFRQWLRVFRNLRELQANLRK
ncbi:uncharacterized protein [Onthophagus taurus]|uniref:uncharacterized protein n=1 Tax=Onthophagus taurus TaxID=166361 RepID=UPI000C20B2A8|nr:uncharacterized protein LOC111414471 [Onthophagus taurus]